ncbi:carbon storage regulator [Pseudomonas palleroniana]|uniref:carbon storage regulator n=1 Tax=Pseudomonas palleroniana TaxID=191390 RepID=UPI003B007753
MLVITRAPNESLRIGDEIQIKVTKIVGDAVFLGVTAPKHIPITRSARGVKTVPDDLPTVEHEG